MNQNGQWVLYIAESQSGKYYVGISTDVQHRLEVHNKGNGSVMGRIDGPFSLRYVSPPLGNQSVARKLEIQVKKWSKEKKTRLVNGNINLQEMLKNL